VVDPADLAPVVTKDYSARTWSCDHLSGSAQIERLVETIAE
jgi:hypothetical protein